VLTISLLVVLILSSISTHFSVTENASAGKYGNIIPTLDEISLLDKINENRTSNGAGALRLNASLWWVARAHSQDMIDYDFFDHTSSEEGQFNGATFKERINDHAEYASGYVGECIAWESWGIDPETVMSKWKASPSHWNIVIDPNFKEVGIGLLEGEWDGWPDSGMHTAVFGGHSVSVDLSIGEVDITFDPVLPHEGDSVNISATIHNLGSTDAYPVGVRFYDGDPGSGGVLIDSQQIPHILIHDEDTVVSTLWDTTGLAGPHDIHVVVDYDDIIPESNEGNNVAYKSLNVNGSFPPIHLDFGWNLVSFPQTVSSTEITTVLSSISGKYDTVQLFDNQGTSQFWKHYYVNKPSHLNTLAHLDNTKGFWINVLDIGGADLDVEGDIPQTPQDVQLKSGWNLVGYPSSTKRLRDVALNNLVFGVDVEVIKWFDSTSNTHIILESGDLIEPGHGYFIFANHDCTWTITP
jgi:hypothetical protein